MNIVSRIHTLETALSNSSSEGMYQFTLKLVEYLIGILWIRLNIEPTTKLILNFCIEKNHLRYLQNLFDG